MTARIIRGDARRLPLPDESVDLIVTSPPYYALRSYTDGGEHYSGQIGSESTPAEYVAALVDCTREWVRVLKPSGSMFIDLGDKYDSGTTAPRTNPGTVKDGKGQGWHLGAPRSTNGRPKSLMLLPERYRIACVDDLGLIARAVIVWSKPNGLPESVTDRVRRSHEDWVHLTKRPRYFSAVDEIRTPAVRDDARASGKRYSSGVMGAGSEHRGLAAQPNHALGSLPGSVWEIPTEPLIVPPELGVDHFAAFPTEWPRRLILGWSPSGICTACGEGRRPIAVALAPAGHAWGEVQKEQRGWNDGDPAKRALGVPASERQRRITGYACACTEPTAPTRPAVVLDPFGGTGTTALLASVLGRHGISVDMSADYCRLARWRTTDPGEQAKAMRVAKPDPIHEDQLALWEAS